MSVEVLDPMYSVIIAIIIGVVVITGEVIALRFVQNGAKSKNCDKMSHSGDDVAGEISGIKDRLGALEVVIGLKSLKKQ